MIVHLFLYSSLPPLLPTFFVPSFSVCAEGDLRIRGGLFVGQGRVEICHENIWGTICDDLWGNVDAAVACRQLGFPGGGEEITRVGCVLGGGEGGIIGNNEAIVH